MRPITMPQVGQDIVSARIVEWRKKEGEAFAKEEIIAVVESDKASFEVAAEQPGVLVKILVPAGEEGQVFEPIAWVCRQGEEAVAASAGGPEVTAAAPETAAASFETSEDPTPIPARRFASPAARREARQRGIGLETIQGTGPGGRILRRDVVAGRPGPQVTVFDTAATSDLQGADEVIPFSRLRRRMAERLLLSQQSIPHFYVGTDVDMTEAQHWRQGFNQAHASHVTVTDLVIFAAARSLREFRRLNAHVERDRLIARGSINVGVATSVSDGLLVPVIPRADRKGLLELSGEARRNAESARRGAIQTPSGGTFTITSLGSLGVPGFLPLVNPPECCILAVGAILPRVVPKDGELCVRQMMSLNLGCDHRAVDGEYAAKFLVRLKQILEDRSCLADDSGDTLTG